MTRKELKRLKPGCLIVVAYVDAPPEPALYLGTEASLGDHQALPFDKRGNLKGVAMRIDSLDQIVYTTTHSVVAPPGITAAGAFVEKNRKLRLPK